MATLDVKKEVRARYGAIAAASGASCCGPSGCGTDAPEAARSQNVGYTAEELQSLPEGANLGLGCGNPLALASLRAGETVLDLGSGAGIDCFLAAKRVGETGHVIGVDMTPEMLDKARENAKKGGYANVEFRKGEIEKLPVDDNSVDAIISNCVINLSPDKPQVFREIHRVLKPGGRFYVSDIVLNAPLPEAIRDSAAVYTACVGGALLKGDYLKAIADAGLRDVNITSEAGFPIKDYLDDPTIAAASQAAPDMSREELENAANSVVSIRVEGAKMKPVAGCCGGA